MAKRTVKLSPQASAFLSALPPEPKRRLRLALRDLGSMKGDILLLEAPLQDYLRLRVAQFRVIFSNNEDAIYCVFIERRSIVYDVFEKLLYDTDN